MSTVPLPNGYRSDLQPALQRRQAQLHSAMGSAAEGPTTIVDCPSAPAFLAQGPSAVGAPARPTKPWVAKCLFPLGGLLALGLVAAVVTQGERKATTTEATPATTGVPAKTPALASAPAVSTPAAAPSEDEAIRDTLAAGLVAARRARLPGPLQPRVPARRRDRPRDVGSTKTPGAAQPPGHSRRDPGPTHRTFKRSGSTGALSPDVPVGPLSGNGPTQDLVPATRGRPLAHRGGMAGRRPLGHRTQALAAWQRHNSPAKPGDNPRLANLSQFQAPSGGPPEALSITVWQQINGMETPAHTGIRRNAQAIGCGLFRLPLRINRS